LPLKALTRNMGSCQRRKKAALVACERPCGYMSVSVPGTPSKLLSAISDSKYLSGVMAQRNLLSSASGAQQPAAYRNAAWHGSGINGVVSGRHQRNGSEICIKKKRHRNSDIVENQRGGQVTAAKSSASISRMA